jgi:DnaD/phage-associated family protein
MAVDGAKEVNKERKAIVRRSDELPNYTTEEISVILEKRKETSYLLDECQQEFGKIFSTRDLNVIVGMLDYLGVDIGYVVALLKYCNKIGKRSTSYAEKLAFSFVEEGIDTTEALKIKLGELEALRDNESAVRKLFGMKARTLTAKEKKCIGLWFGKFGYGVDVVRRAYEITVEAINEPSVSYAHAIIERWYNEGVKTLEDIDKSVEAYRAEKAKSNDSQSSFDTDDFFEAALRRSYEG